MAKFNGALTGIEAKIEYHAVFEELGALYESWKRSAVNWMQTEKLSESEVEKRLMKKFNIQWAYADSIATEARTCLNQLKTAKNNYITKLEFQLSAKTAAAKKLIIKLEKTLKLATKKCFPHIQARNKFCHQYRIRRTQLFQWRKAVEGILTHDLWAEHQLSQQVHIETGK
ncbi:hypothetical protein [Okeania sp. SIO2B3]|uniref:hypothetical protein n=1 Tax=Okeania sp. SIO2B3 TaxID=2607784 RepID=UPI0013BF8F1F|nr:hypothetical protein [Okeania sp. SIO2B3]NET44330.1 hypothetical protein [Okeania sp. SIO2B3]